MAHCKNWHKKLLEMVNLLSPIKPRQYQLLLWPSSLIIPIFTKGYDGNFLKLTPCVLLSIVLPSLIAVQVNFSRVKVIDSVLVPAKCLRGKIFRDATVLRCAAQVHRKFERSAGRDGRARRDRGADLPNLLFGVRY
jgi:hypothetical protein